MTHIFLKKRSKGAGRPMAYVSDKKTENMHMRVQLKRIFSDNTNCICFTLEQATIITKIVFIGSAHSASDIHVF